MSFELAVFDMDGTTLDTAKDLCVSLNTALEACGFSQRRSVDEVRSFAGNGIHRLVELGVPEGTSDDDIEAVFAAFNKHYAVHCNDFTKPYDGIKEAVSEVRRRGIKTALISNKADYAVQDLCKLHFQGLFDYAVGEKEGIRRKPCPDSLNEVMRRLGMSKEQTVYVGDSEVDLKTAENGGTACIAVLWGFRERSFLLEHGARKEFMAEDPKELPDMISR